MSKDVAIISATGVVVNVKVCDDDYQPQPYEVVVTGSAWVGGDYVGGYFYPPQPFPSWTRHEGSWLPPTPMPTDGGLFVWHEETQNWEPVNG